MERNPLKDKLRAEDREGFRLVTTLTQIGER